MKNAILAAAWIMVCLSAPALGDELVPLPAASDDLEAFDRRVSESMNEGAGVGSVVSDEAKKLRAAEPPARKAFGQTVSQQRRSELSQGNSSEGSTAGAARKSAAPGQKRPKKNQ